MRFTPSRRFLVFVLLGLSASSLRAQADTLLHIPEVEIVAQVIRKYAPGGQVVTWRKKDIENLRTTDVLELLQTDGVFIKSYGLGSLATSSIRGGSAGHTLVLWNGLPVQSPMLGQLDLNLLPLQSFGSVSLERGGGSGAWGSGAIGGVVSMDTRLGYFKGTRASSETVFGDFGRLRQAIALEVGTGKIASKTTFGYREARNDFSYPIAENFPERKQSNARLFQRVFTQDIGWKISEKDKLEAHLWHQTSLREIPPTNQQSVSLAEQKDGATRLALDYSHRSSGLIFNAQAAFFDEELVYTDDRVGLTAPSAFRTFLAEATAQVPLGERHKLFGGTTLTRSTAMADGYEDEVGESRWSAYAMWRFTSHDLVLQTGLRQEAFDGQFVQPLPSIGVDYEPIKNWMLRGKLSRNFRLPTLNDRYWSPGGNPDLKAESGWSQEISVENSFELLTASINWSVAGYSRQIDNWILWSPDATGGYWSASNLATVWSRGAELRAGADWKIARAVFSLNGGYDHVLSTSKGRSDALGLSQGQQLLYTPECLAFGAATAAWKGFFISYRHSFVGSARGVYETISAFQTADLRIQYSRKTDATFGSFSTSVFFDIMNLYDADYFIIDRRPMPGINFQAGIRIQFDHLKQK